MLGEVSAPQLQVFTAGLTLHLSLQGKRMADRWLIEYGTSREKMTIVGKAGTRADAAATAQAHLDTRPAEPGAERLVFPADNPAGEYCCAGGIYRITRLGSGQWRAIVD